MSSLKAELRGEVLPEFTLTLPEGWVRLSPDDRVRDEMLATAKKRFMQAHRPDLYAQAQGMVKKLFSEMQRVEAVAFFTPRADAPPSAYLPATLTASIRRGENGSSMDGAIAQLIRMEGATPLGDDKRILRWERDTVESFEGARVATTTVAYFTPVPETGRTRALQFTLVISHKPEEEGDADFVTALKLLFDAHLSTFAWLPA